MLLEGKVAIIVGSGSGIGKAAARLLASEGAAVMLADIDPEGARKVEEEIRGNGGRAATVQADMTKEEDAQKMVQAALEQFGRVDILVNVAGGSQGRFIRERLGPFAESTREEWDRILDVNLNGARNCTRAVINHMLERGSGKIINMSSMAGVSGAPNAVDYSAAKAGLIGFTKALAQEMAPHGIQVNSISPGGVYTERLQAVMERHKREGAQRTFDVSKLSTPEEIARIILFLASADVKNLNGINIEVHGSRR
ncbi:MAG TPA: glucose 1-dehydrogenase [Firmicutes bacterium]|nr:glucose 1-dehydrogenase [Bacillota bacterium]